MTHRTVQGTLQLTRVAAENPRRKESWQFPVDRFGVPGISPFSQLFPGRSLRARSQAAIARIIYFVHACLDLLLDFASVVLGV
jgi:hypothetical protein